MYSTLLTVKDVQLLTSYSEEGARRHRRAILDSLGKVDKKDKLTIWDWCNYHRIDDEKFLVFLVRLRKGTLSNAA